MAINSMSGFYANKLYDDRMVWTSFNGDFDSGFTEIDIRNLSNVQEGKTPVYTVFLKVLASYTKELRDGKRVDIYVDWDRDDETDEYSNIHVTKVEVV